MARHGDYVHGGFKGTDTKFSFYFPDRQVYQGRLFQHITPDNENLAQKDGPGEENKIGFGDRSVWTSELAMMSRRELFQRADSAEQARSQAAQQVRMDLAADHLPWTRLLGHREQPERRDCLFRRLFEVEHGRFGPVAIQSP